VCRIAIFKDKLPEKKQVTEYLDYLETTQGGDGNGIFIMKNKKKFIHFKGVKVKIQEIVDALYKEQPFKFAIFHTRLKTHGEKSDANCQPIVINNDKCFLVFAHNGVIGEMETFKPKVAEVTSLIETFNMSDSSILAHLPLCYPKIAPEKECIETFKFFAKESKSVFVLYYKNKLLVLNYKPMGFVKCGFEDVPVYGSTGMPKKQSTSFEEGVNILYPTLEIKLKATQIYTPIQQTSYVYRGWRKDVDYNKEKQKTEAPYISLPKEIKDKYAIETDCSWDKEKGCLITYIVVTEKETYREMYIKREM